MKKPFNLEHLPSLSKDKDSLNKLIIEGERDAKRALEMASTLRGKSYSYPKRDAVSSKGK